MNAREWCALTGAPAVWAELAARLDAVDGGLEAVFDDAGRAGLSFAPDAGRWRALRRALAGRGAALPAGPVPERSWFFLEGKKAAELWNAWGGPSPRLSCAAPDAAASEGPLARGALGCSGVSELDALLGDFAGLHPAAGVLTGLDRLEVRLAEPAAWPLFARTDLAKPFAGRPAFWARRLGARGVSAFALGRGRMEIFVV
ncbi:MAG: hypothetical protein HY928_14485 [Elusimicrobia bacterium]|nr:hypothetical protein [Elusimicrobiota bacterium]